MQKRLTPKEFKQVYGKVPRLCVDLVIMDKGGILFTKRAINPCKGQWHLPGGTVLFNETLEQAAHRVAKEELGIKIKIHDDLGYMQFFIKGKKYHAMSIAFISTPKGNSTITLDRQASEYKYFKNLDKNTVKEHKAFLTKYIRRHKNGTKRI